MKKLSILVLLIMALMSCEESEIKLQTDVIDFYNWNMQEVSEMIIFNPIDADRIDRFHVVIFSDYDICMFKVLDISESGNVTIEGDKIIMSIDEGGIFDNESFNSTDQFRGNVVIKYY